MSDPLRCPYCQGSDVRRGEVITGACFGPNRIPRPTPARVVIYCGFCGCTTAPAPTWEQAETWWKAGAPDGNFGPQGEGNVYVPACDPREPRRGARAIN